MSKTLGSLSVGAKIEVPVLSAYQSRFGSKIVFKIADKNHSGYPSNSVTLITEKIIQNMASDAKAHHPFGEFSQKFSAKLSPNFL